MTDVVSPEYAELFAAAVEAARRRGISVADPTPPDNVSRVANGRGLHFLDWQGGQRRPILLLHGALLQAHVWDFFGLELRERFHIRALDLPGHGDSQWAPDGDYTRARVAADIAALVETLDLKALVLVGHSFGGSVAAMVAARMPERIDALVMVDSTLLPSGRPSVRTRAAALPPTFASLEDFAQHAAGLGRGRDPARLVTSLRWNARRLPDGRWTWKYDPALRHTALGPASFEDVWSALYAFSGPLLFVRAGEHSHLADEAASRLQSLPNLRLVVVDNAAHNVMSDNPVAFNRAVGRFLRHLDGRDVSFDRPD
jgi:pimeloyl-ACP methyl ester carboxylesterase